MPKKKLGQNFLIDPNIVRKTISLTDPKKGDTIIEIGPGLGTMAKAILETGVTLHAVETRSEIARSSSEFTSQRTP